jgi:hypothetical protein
MALLAVKISCGWSGENRRYLLPRARTVVQLFVPRTAVPTCFSHLISVDRQTTQLDRQGTKCVWRGPVGQQKSAQRHDATNVASFGVQVGTEDD